MSKPSGNSGIKTGEYVGFFLIIGGIGVIGFQIFLWLKEGVWFPISLITVLSFFSDWAYNPRDWVGFWKMLNAIPISVLLIFIGWNNK